jgi:hypothetical protein
LSSIHARRAGNARAWNPLRCGEARTGQRINWRCAEATVASLSQHWRGHFLAMNCPLNPRFNVGGMSLPCRSRGREGTYIGGQRLAMVPRTKITFALYEADLRLLAISRAASSETRRLWTCTNAVTSTSAPSTHVPQYDRPCVSLNEIHRTPMRPSRWKPFGQCRASVWTGLVPACRREPVTRPR